LILSTPQAAGNTPPSDLKQTMPRKTYLDLNIYLCVFIGSASAFALIVCLWRFLLGPGFVLSGV
jgi:hypothetical protein